MNVTFIPNLYLPNIGGVELTVYYLSQRFTEMGHKVNIITTRYPLNLKSHEIIDGICVDRIFRFMYFYQSNILDLPKFICNLFLIPFNTFKVWRLLRKYRSEVVNVFDVSQNSLYILLSSYLHRFKLIVTLLGFTIAFPTIINKKFSIAKIILRKADYVTANSDNLLQLTFKNQKKLGEKYFVIPNGVNLSEFSLREKYLYPKSYIFSLGRFMGIQKGFDILLIAFSRVIEKGYDIDLILAGDGPGKKDYERIIALLNLKSRVKFFGTVERKEAVSLFKGCLFFVCSSRFESSPIVNLQAMAAKKAVLTTNVNGIPEIIKDGINGLLVKPQDDKALAVGMMRLLDDSKLRDKLGDNGRRMVKDYTWENIAGRYLEIYQKVLEN